MFETGRVWPGRADIIGDLTRLRLRIYEAEQESRALENRLALLAAIAVAQGKSREMVTRASDVSTDRINNVLRRHGLNLIELAKAEGYELANPRAPGRPTDQSQNTTSEPER